MTEDTFDQTKAFIEHHPDAIKNMGYLITHDPTTGKKAANFIFVTGNEVWVVDHTLANGHFKQTYLVEKTDSGERGVLAITKSPISKKTPELNIAERLKERHVVGASEILGLYYLNTGQKAILYRYYNGGDLQRKITEGTLTDNDRKIIAERLIRGTAELHRNGIFHRDLKPANVLLQVDLERSVTDAVLSDFGEGTIMDNPQSIQNIEHHHSAPEGNAAMETHKKELTEWYEIQEERKRLEESEVHISSEFKKREMIAEENVASLAQLLKEITTSASYDSWGLGLTLWCLFANRTNTSFPWEDAVNHIRYGEIASLKKEFSESNPCKDFPELYAGIISGLLEHDYSKRLTAEKASQLLE